MEEVGELFGVVVWTAVILMGFVSVIGGLIISGWYLTKIRPKIARAEAGVGP